MFHKSSSSENLRFWIVSLVVYSFPKKTVPNWKSLKIAISNLMKSFLTLYHTIATFENTVRKGENAGNQNFFLFPQCFLHHHNFCKNKFIMMQLYAFNLCQSKIFFIKTGAASV